jgi:hypothetical protein
VSDEGLSNVTKVILFPYLRQETGQGFLEGWPGVSNTESKQIELDGIRESPFLELVTSDTYAQDSMEQNNVVWLGDTIGKFHPTKGIGGQEETWCEAFGSLLRQVQMEHHCAGQASGSAVDNNINSTQMPTQNLALTVHIVDWADMHYHQRCHNVEHFVGQSHVQYHKRGRVEGRHWNPRTQWIERGNRKTFFALEGRPYHDIPLTVRTDTIEAIEYTLATHMHTSQPSPAADYDSAPGGIKLADRIERILPRPYDVICLWPLPNSTEAKHIGSEQEAKFRFKVSQVVHKIGEHHHLNYYVGLAGRATQHGRWGVMLEYIQMLLSSKIVVVTNRDQWEDHYRLMEALSSGALVMTDQWVQLPLGLKDGTSIIEFTSAQDLEYLIMYYLRRKKKRLKIAAEGRRVAMAYHRTWHRMEQIILGDIQTKCDETEGDTEEYRDCIYRVHVDNSVPTNCTELKQEFGTVLECLSWEQK